MFCDKVLSGSFTTPASGNANQVVQLPFQPDLVEVWVQGNSSGDNWANVTANPGVVKYAFWQSGMAAASALCTANTNGAATDTSSFLSSGGITLIQTAPNNFGAAQTGSGITAATPAVMTLTNSNVYQSGDIVLIQGTTGALQFSGIPWSVVSTGATTYNLGISGTAFSSAAFAAAATAVTTRKVLYPNTMTPYVSYIVAISTGSTTTITTSYPHGLTAGDVVRVVIPSQWGTTQISGLTGTVTSVTNSIKFVCNINSSSATAFAFPTTAVAGAGVTWPQVIPMAEGASQFDISATDGNYQGFQIGNSATAGAAILNEASALVLWRAQQSAKVYTSLTA